MLTRFPIAAVLGGLYCLFFSIPAAHAQDGLSPIFVADGISGPTDIQHAGDGSGRLFLVEQAGRIKILRDGAVLPQPFLDIRSLVKSGGEQGLLGLAFSPTFVQSQRFFVNYTNLNGDTVIAQYRISSNRDVAEVSSQTILMTIAQPFANHNGGQIRFGPDGYLYIGMGDGGSAGDPMRNAQNLNSLLGKILRVDVESQSGQVRIPPDNPFVNRTGARPEIWAYGLRNPWRFSFDRVTGDLWIADVGQSMWEEVNFQPASSHGGENYGWNVMEGAHCYNGQVCIAEAFTPPEIEYDHEFGNCSVTGGFVYRGTGSPGLRGNYIYGDYCSGFLRSILRGVGSLANTPSLNSGFRLATFGEDELGEIYVADAAAGRIYRLVGPHGPVFVKEQVVNSASFHEGIVPGSLATVFVAGVRDAPGISAAGKLPLPTTLDGVSVRFGNKAAPILSVSNVNGIEQVNFQVPFDQDDFNDLNMTVARSGEELGRAVRTQKVAPGVFTLDGITGIAVHNATYQLVSPDNALVGGEYAFVYATGLGPVTNPPATGAATPESPLAMAQLHVMATLDGAPCEVPFAGLAPGYAGLFQINFKVPSGLTNGLKDFILTVDGVSAPPVKLAVLGSN